MVSVNVSSKEFLQAESTDSKELQDRVGQLRLRWDAAQGAVESWREGLRLSLMQCQVRRLSTQPVPKAQSRAQPGPRGQEKRYVYHLQAAFAQPNMLCVRKHVLYHLFPKRPACCLRDLMLALHFPLCCPDPPVL